MSAIVVVEGVEEVLEVSDGEGSVAVELSIQDDGGDVSEGPYGFIVEADLYYFFDLHLYSVMVTSSCVYFFSRKGSI